MSKKIRHLFFLLINCLCFGCNNDIFVDSVPEIPNYSFALDGNGGAVEFDFPMDMVNGMAFGCEDEYFAQAVYYDKNGMRMDDLNLENVAFALYASPQFCLEIIFDGAHVEAKALDNTTDCNQHIWLAFEHAYGSSTIDFIISPGRPFMISELFFDMENSVSGRRAEHGPVQSFTNDTDASQRVVIYPYQEARSQICVQPATSCFWAAGATEMCYAPFYSGIEWGFDEGNEAQVVFGETVQFVSPGVDADEEYSIEVPPHSNVATVTEVAYATLEVGFVAYLVQPGSGLKFYSEGKCQLSQPINYKIEEQ